MATECHLAQLWAWPRGPHKQLLLEVAPGHLQAKEGLRVTGRATQTMIQPEGMLFG